MNTENIHIGHLIKEKLKEQERSVAWLARQINYNDANLGRVLKENQHIHSELLIRISKTMKFDFFTYYSMFLHDNNYLDEIKECKTL